MHFNLGIFLSSLQPANVTIAAPKDFIHELLFSILPNVMIIRVLRGCGWLLGLTVSAFRAPEHLRYHDKHGKGQKILHCNLGISSLISPINKLKKRHKCHSANPHTLHSTSFHPLLSPLPPLPHLSPHLLTPPLPLLSPSPSPAPSQTIPISLRLKPSIYIPAISIHPYPTEITTRRVRTEAGIPREIKCLTRKYLIPVCESSIIIAADFVSLCSTLVLLCS